MSPAQRSGAACSSAYPSGTGKQKRSSATASSRVPAVEVVAGEARAVAEVLPVRERSSGTSPSVHPSHGTPTRVAGLEPRPALEHLADDLVAEDERELRLRELAVDDVEVGAAHAARAHPKQHLPVRGLGIRKLGEPQRLARRVEHHRAHQPGSWLPRATRCKRAQRVAQVTSCNLAALRATSPVGQSACASGMRLSPGAK